MSAASVLASLALALNHRPLPYRDPSRLVAFWENSEINGELRGMSGPDLTEFAEASRSLFSSIGGFAVPRFWLMDTRGSTEVHVCIIQASAFEDLGVRPVLGRAVLPDDSPVSTTGIAPAWISYRLWQDHYASNPSILGTTFVIASSPTGFYPFSLRIAGVLPQDVSIPLPFTDKETDVWYLFEKDVSSRPRQSDIFYGLARLMPGVSPSQAQAALSAAVERSGQRYGFEAHRRPTLQSLRDIVKGPVPKP